MLVAVATVATSVLLLAHVPPAVELASVVVSPLHTVVLPVIAAIVGKAVTVTVPVELLT